jgi:quercetin dioxygenase-like cupin family protein
MSIALSSAVLTGTALYIRTAVATPASGFVGTTLALGRLGEIDTFNHLVQHGMPPWLSIQKTKGLSDLYVQNNVWQPGGSTGWHSHPGHSLIIVTSGALTDYESNTPGCTPTVYTKGMAFVDPGGDHVHNIRNETSDVATNVAVQLIPANAVRRVDAPQPANCPVF